MNLQNKNIVIVAHILTTVPAEDLETYFLQEKIKNLFFIGHPLFYKKGRPGSHYRLYTENTLVKQKTLANRPLISIIQYIKDVFLTVWWVIASRKKWDSIIALDNLNTFAGLILRTLGFVDKVIYYTIDFTPQRFDNALLNRIYHVLEKFAVKHADSTWILTDRVAEGREKLLGMDRAVYNKQIIVPIGTWLNRIERKDFKNVSYHTLVYAGGLVPHQGIQNVLDSIPLIVKNIPDFEFKIIGMGTYEKALKQQVKKLKIGKYVQFLGYKEKHEDVENILTNCGLAIAMYNKELARWSYYADSSKIKTYLASGLPVITTSLTQISKEITQRECGVVIEDSKEAIAKAVIDVMNNKRKYKNMRANAITFSEEFDWSRIFANALKHI